MSILSDTVRGVGRLLFPVRCPVCGGKMPPGSRVVCTRCRYADERCRTEEPPFLDMGGGHFVACHRVNEEA